MGGGRELVELTRVRVLLFLREPEAVFWVFVFPLVLAAVLGFAFRESGPAPGRVGILSDGRSSALAELLERDLELELIALEDSEEAQRKVQGGSIDLLVKPGTPPELVFDPQRSEAVAARLRVLRALDLEASGGRAAEVTMTPQEGEGSRYIDFLFPGLLGMNLMGTGMWGIGFAIADIRRRKLLKRLLVTPMTRSSFFLSFLLSRLVFLVMEVVVLCCLGTWLLGVPFRASLVPFALLSVLGSFTFAGLGLLAASRAKTIEAVSGLLNLVMMPMWLASGVFFSYERFPEWTHSFLKLLPLTALNDGLRGMLLEGEGLGEHLGALLVLVLWALGSFLVALKIFRWE